MTYLGIDLGGTKTSVCFGDLDGNVVGARRMPTRHEDGVRVWLGRTVRLANELAKDSGVSLSRVARIGLAAPGPVSVSAGKMLRPPNQPGWIEVPIVTLVEEAFGIPVSMNHDAKASVLAEYYFGGFRGASDIVFLTASTGMGGGIIANGKLVQGQNDTAGEVGHIVLCAKGPRCPCGKRGCFEVFCGGRNVEQRLRRITVGSVETILVEEAGGKMESITMETLLAAVRKGDRFASVFWHEFLLRLAQGIGTVITVLNPRAVLLGTIGVHAGETMFLPLGPLLERFTWKEALASCFVGPSTLGDSIGDLSTLALLRHHRGGQA